MPVQSVDRALQLLQLVGEEPARLVALAERADLAVSTTARLLGTLEGLGAVRRDSHGDYRLGPFIYQLADAAAPPPPGVEEVAADELMALAGLLDEATCLSVPTSGEMVTVLQFDTPKDVLAVDWTGRRWSMTGGGSGHVLLATWPADGLDRAISDLDEQARQSIRQEIAYVRSTGIAWSREVHVKGINSVAAAITGPDDVGVASVVAYGPSYRFPAKGQVKRIESQVAQAAQNISERLRS